MRGALTPRLPKARPEKGPWRKEEGAGFETEASATGRAEGHKG